MSEARPVVVLTRRRVDSEDLARVLRARGADVLLLPCVRTRPLEDSRELASTMASLGASDVLVLTSRAGAEAVAPFGPRAAVAAVGRATADRARSLGLAVAFVPSVADSATLASELPLPAGDVVLARSDLAEQEPVAILRARGARAREVVAYRTVPELDADATPLVEALRDRRVAILVGSPSALTALTRAIPVELLRRAAFVATGRRTARAVGEDLGSEAIVPAAEDDLANALIAAAHRMEELVR